MFLKCHLRVNGERTQLTKWLIPFVLKLQFQLDYLSLLHQLKVILSKLFQDHSNFSGDGSTKNSINSSTAVHFALNLIKSFAYFQFHSFPLLKQLINVFTRRFNQRNAYNDCAPLTYPIIRFFSLFEKNTSVPSRAQNNESWTRASLTDRCWF